MCTVEPGRSAAGLLGADVSDTECSDQGPAALSGLPGTALGVVSVEQRRRTSVSHSSWLFSSFFHYFFSLHFLFRSSNSVPDSGLAPGMGLSLWDPSPSRPVSEPAGWARLPLSPFPPGPVVLPGPPWPVGVLFPYRPSWCCSGVSWVGPSLGTPQTPPPGAWWGRCRSGQPLGDTVRSGGGR